MFEYAILVNTTDSFKDCWYPFFTLFRKFWPDYIGKIYLNTETEVFTFSGLEIISVKNGQKSWSASLEVALEGIEDEIVLYLQEDYFLKDFVKTQLLNDYVVLIKNNQINCLHLTDQCGSGPFHASSIGGLVKMDQKAKYRVNCQAALWKKEVLKSYLYKGESGWDFEAFGTLRSHYIKDDFYAVDPNLVKINQFEIIPYVFTGIVRGKWWPEVKALFAKNGIDMDFSKRGFYEKPKKKPLINKLITQIRRQPKLWRTYWKILNIILKKIRRLNM